MTDSMRVANGKLSPISAMMKADAAAPVAAKMASAIKAPNAPATGLANAAARPQAMAMDDSISAAHMGAGIASLATQRPWGPSFSFTKMSEAEAIAATTASLAALSANIHGITGTGHGFAPAQATRDELGYTHVRLDRTYGGIKIWAEQAVSHLDKEGKVVDITGNTLPKALHVSTTPTVAFKTALEIAGRAYGNVKASATFELVVIKSGDAYHLAYHVTFRASGPAGAARTHVFVDAHTGVVLPNGYAEGGGFIPEFKRQLLKQNTAMRSAPAAMAAATTAEAGTGNSIYLGQVKLNTVKNGDTFELKDPATSAQTRDAHNGEGGAGSENTILTDNNNVWGEKSDDARQRAGIDAQYAAQEFLKYLKTKYNRNSLDDKGLVLLSNVHVNDNYVNAYWDGTSMNYGDGDGKDAGELVDKDVGSHEPTHGLTESTSGLVYSGESGALNEAGSDILGSAGFSWYLRGGGEAILNDFLIGEDCWTPGIPGDALRYMNDPMKDRQGGSDLYSRDNYKTRYKGSFDNGGVHLNSGIANNYFYLLVQGGTNRTSGIKVEKGIGMEKALQIYFRAHTIYFTPNTTFAQARDAMLKAAGDLYGANSVEQKTVAQAWTAVGVESGKTESVSLVG